MKNYFNQLTLSQKIDQLGKCRFMDPNEFNDGVSALKGISQNGIRTYK